jgi:hypothetical protein
METESKLSIPEKIFLLSINPEKGGLVNWFGYSLDLSLAAAFIMELHVRGNIEILGNRIGILNPDSGDRLARFVLSKFEKFDRPLTIGRWINRLHFFSRQIKRELKTGMAGKRLIRLEERQFWFFSWARPYLYDRTKAGSLRSGIEKIVFSGELNPEDKYILSLAEPSGLMRRLFPVREQRRNARRRIRQSGVENEISIALKRAIVARRAAAS